MKINITNKEKLQTTLNIIQAKSRARNCNIYDVEKLVKAAEDYLNHFDIPKKYWKESIFEFAEHVNCNSYSRKSSYFADSTVIQVTRGTTGWFLTACQRESLITSNGNNDYSFSPSEICKTWAKENLYLQFLDGF
jgi:hypothetical protein